MTAELKAAFSGSGPLQMIYRVNSGHIPTSSWLHESEEGGGMLIGEMCHFVDLMAHVCGGRPQRVFAQALQVGKDDVSDLDNLTITVSFSGGSVGTLCYNTGGDKAASKERLEVYGEGKVACLDDFRILDVTAGGKHTRRKALNQDKGQANQIALTLNGMTASGTAPIPFVELEAVMQAIFAARRSIQSGEAIEVGFDASVPTVEAG
jgi:predicted dehydrogenase